VARFLQLFAAVSVTDTTLTDTNPTAAPAGTPVEGSNGLLLEVDGKVVPNYAATMVSFEEGDVVKGKVVRIDKDEVLGPFPRTSSRSASRSIRATRSSWARRSTPSS